MLRAMHETLNIVREGTHPGRVRKAMAQQSQCQPACGSHNSPHVENKRLGRKFNLDELRSTWLLMQFLSLSPKNNFCFWRIGDQFREAAASRPASLCISQGLTGRAVARSLDTAIRRMFK